MSGQCEDCCGPKDLTHTTPGYRRALVIVVVLNLGMGVVEMAGGVFGRSQALKADSLDFLGDGAITLLGLLAISRGQRWRARAALLQGFFLAILGVGVIGAACFRLYAKVLPDAATMGVLGVVGLVVNVVCALVLVPHRNGDANVRAVWLFSRNDAIGNMAVVVAGGLVGWSGQAWPDLVTAAVIAALFLASAWQIIRGAQHELKSREGGDGG